MKKKGAKRARASEREGKEQQLGFTRISRRCVSRETKTERSLGRGKPFVASMPTPRNRKMSDDSFSFPFFFRHGSAPRLSFFSFEMQISTRRGVRPSFPSTSRDARDHPSFARPSPPPLSSRGRKLDEKNIRRLEYLRAEAPFFQRPRFLRIRRGDGTVGEKYRHRAEGGEGRRRRTTITRFDDQTS